MCAMSILEAPWLTNAIRPLVPRSLWFMMRRTVLASRMEDSSARAHFLRRYAGVLRPVSDYTPWNDDEDFRRVFERIRGSTLVDEYRCYELWQLTAQALKVGGDLIEIGVWRGGTGGLIATRAQRESPVSQVFLCDTFSGVVKASEKDNYYKGGEHADTSLASVHSLLGTDLGLTNTTLLQGIFPDDTGTQVQERSFCFAHIDVDTYDSAKGCLEWLWPRLRVHGIVVFDDFGFSVCPGVTELVEAQRDFRDRIVIHNLNGHGVLIRTA